MVRSAHWRNAAPQIQEWVLFRFEISDRSPWDYIDHQVTLKEVGINQGNFFKELASAIPDTKRDDWSEYEWWSRVSKRVFYLFHRAADSHVQPHSITTNREALRELARAMGEWLCSTRRQTYI
jgi:hypothetical protein